MSDFKKTYERYVVLPKQIIKKRKKDIKRRWKEMQEFNKRWNIMPTYKLSNELLINILGFLIAMYDTFDDIRKECKDYNQSLIKLIFSRRRMSKEMKFDFFDPQKDSERIFEDTKKMINDTEGKWDSLCNRDKFYSICENVLYYDLIEEGNDLETSADLSYLTLELLFPIFLSEINNVNWE